MGAVLQRIRQAGAAEIAAAILALALISILGAWTFEAFGYLPCELCLKQRIPYYAGIPLAALTLWLARKPGPYPALPAAFLGLAMIFYASLALGVYHSGVEWGLWPGPAGCTGQMQTAANPAEFLKQLQTARVVRCDEPAFRIFGLSMAGMNAIVSFVVAALAVAGSRRV